MYYPRIPPNLQYLNIANVEHDLQRLTESESDMYAFSFMQAGESAIRIFKIGFPDAVVWNIGSDRASSLKDLGACALGTPVILAVRR